ncbi:MAG TPA: NlpC/P60 family protein [Trebonia sp.]|nr:NlpC/P60 family protein [Trebonia sp.]
MRELKVTFRSELTARLSGSRRRAALLGVAVLAALGLATAVTQGAGALPQPSIDQVQAKVNSLTTQSNKADQQYDSAEQQLTAAKARLATVNKQLASEEATYKLAQQKVQAIADSNYEDSAQTSLAGLLTSANPGQVLAEASIVLQVTNTRTLETQTFLAAATALSNTQQEQQRTEQGVAQLAAQKTHTKNHIQGLLNAQKAILDSLTAQQQAVVNAATSNAGGGTTTAKYTGPTGSQADAAVQFVFNQLGCQYTYGATGPCSVGFDCSGLVMAAWASAGVTIPRDTYGQWAALPHIPVSEIKPGDLLYYNGIGHVAMYVGGGMIIDAPTTGQVVRELPMSTSWYASSLDGAAVP